MTATTTRGTTNRNARGGSDARRVRKQWLLDTFGDGTTASCAFGCGQVLDIDTVTVDRHPTPGCRGGTYRRGNIRPACADCNSRHGGALRGGDPMDATITRCQSCDGPINQQTGECRCSD
jgi:hypothetical protein